MKVIKKIAELRSLLQGFKKEGKTIGLVPTMGYLHRGHASLSIRFNLVQMKIWSLIQEILRQILN